MSQPLDFGTANDPLNQPLTHTKDLVQLFYGVERPKEQWKIGIEYEIFGQIDHGLRPLPYEGAISISSLFSHLIEKSKNSVDPFLPLREENHLVGLICDRTVIALEPGGQIEVALKPFISLKDVARHFGDVVKQIDDACKDLSIQLFALGLHPLAKREDMAVVKKARYGIMRSYMGSLTGLGLDMMTRSSAIQVNLDYSDEQDMIKKARIGAVLVPFYALFCASSVFIEGKAGPHAIERANIWRMTDPDRTGIPPIIFDKNFGYEAWIQLVLDVPMYFIRRGNSYHDVASASFRDFIKHGLKGMTATVRDFVDHMSTVFTELRLKPILELRTPDSLPVPFVNAMSALSYALFYQEQSHERFWALFDGIDHQELIAFHYDVIDKGREARFRGEPAMGLAEKLVALAQDVLKTQSEDAKLLDPLALLVEKNLTCADWIRQRFSAIDNNNLPDLLKHFSPFANPLL